MPCPEEVNGDPTSPALREYVLTRDGHRCRWCWGSENLMVHQVLWRHRDGGLTEPSNLSTLCSRCHALVHEGLLVVKGTAPDNLTFEDRRGRRLEGEGSDRAPGPIVRIVKRGDGAQAPPPSTASGAQAPPPPGAHVARAPAQAAPSDARTLSSICEPPAPSASDGTRAPLGPDTDGAQAPPLPPSSGAQAPPRLPLTLEALPAVIGPSEWRHYAHLFTWNDRRRLLLFEPVLEEALEERPLEEHSLEPPAHRAASLADLVGQRRVVRALEVAIAAAKKRGGPVAHTLLHGMPGLGKTSLALAVAREMQSRASVTSGPMLSDLGALLGLLSSVRERDVIFVDEIHALSRPVAEALYEAMEDRSLSVPVSDGRRTRTVRVRLEPFTLVGATTDPDRLPSPLRSRFSVREEIDPYSVRDLCEIVTRAATREGVAIETEAAALLGRVGRGTPREALRLYERVRDEAIAEEKPAFDRALLERTLGLLEIDASSGLTAIERRILEALRRRGPMGAARLAAAAGISPRALREVYEPFLLRTGRIVITPRGRAAA